MKLKYSNKYNWAAITIAMIIIIIIICLSYEITRLEWNFWFVAWSVLY